MRIIVLGNKGMLGSVLESKLKKLSYHVAGYDIDEMDITKNCKKISEKRPDAVINCAAYTNVDLAETEKERCYAANVIGVKNIVKECSKFFPKLIHISTDYVFNGEKESYVENDKKSPINYYGKTKAEAEDIVKAFPRAYIVRTSWLFGRNGVNFVNKIIEKSKEQKEIKVIDDQFGRPTYTNDLADAIIQLINSGYSYHIYHLTNSGQCSWYEFAKETAKIKKFKCKIIPCKTKDFPTKAKRPKYSILENNLLPDLRHWKEALNDYLKE